VVETLTPSEVVADIVEQVVDFDVNGRIEGSLIAKLQTARRALDNDRKNSRTIAVNSLDAFINAVEAQRSKKISEAEADVIIVLAQEIIAALSVG